MGRDDVWLCMTTEAERCLARMDPVQRKVMIRGLRARVAAHGVGILADPEGDFEVVAIAVEHGLVLIFAGSLFQRIPSAWGLRELYGLTATEARVAQALVSRHAPHEIADSLEIAMSTVRTHLRVAYSKVGATSQADLVRRLLHSAAVLTEDG